MGVCRENHFHFPLGVSPSLAFTCVIFVIRGKPDIENISDLSAGRKGFLKEKRGRVDTVAAIHFAEKADAPFEVRRYF